MERREFQIRETNDYGEEEVTCFTNLSEANEEYYKRLETAQSEGLAIEFELIEVLLQDHSKPVTGCTRLSRRVCRIQYQKGGVAMPYQPKTGRRCACKPGQQRDNCPTCEGTGWVIDFRAIRIARQTKKEELPS